MLTDTVGSQEEWPTSLDPVRHACTDTQHDPARRASTDRALREIRVLGPLELVGKNGTSSFRSHRERIILAMLALNAGRLVAVSALMVAIWGDSPPRTSRTQIQICIGAVRQRIAESEIPARIVTRHPGYMLEIPHSHLDYMRFESLIGSARASELEGDIDGALRATISANMLWRGQVLADVHSDVVQRESIGLEERGIEAEVSQARLGLSLSPVAEVIPSLRRLVADHPLREELYACLMLAFYRSGRQADALDVYHQARLVLGDEIGIEPSANLRRLYVAILNHADGLDMSTYRSPTSPEPRMAAQR